MVSKIFKVKNRRFLNFVVVVVVVLLVVDLFCPRYSDKTDIDTAVMNGSLDLYALGNCNRPG